jgi:hypothetical protein
MQWTHVSRRQFLFASGALAATSLTSLPAVAEPPGSAAPCTIYRLSLRGRRGSRAAKAHNANLRFATQATADASRAHPGDHSRIVPLVISGDEYRRLFADRNSLVADLRRLGGSSLVGDCNRDGRVTIDELLRGVSIALGISPVQECTPFDAITDGRVTVDELVRGIRSASR